MRERPQAAKQVAKRFRRYGGSYSGYGNHGFTLIELMVSLSVMALLALLSWRGLDGMVRVQTSVHQRMDGVVTLQTGLTQWSADLDALFETGAVNAVDYNGRVLRLTRRDATDPGNPLRVVGWTQRLVDSPQGSRNTWVRWQSPAVRTNAELANAWGRAAAWGQNASDEEIRREVAITGIDQWEIFYYRNDAWTNPQSSAASGSTVTSTAGQSASPSLIPDGIRLVLTLSEGQPLTGQITKDWVRPILGGGKS